MTIPPSPGRRKRRLVRPEGPPDDLLLVIRAMPVSRSAAVDQMVEDAEFSARLYVLEGEGGGRELLYGISVFAHGASQDPRGVLDRFRAAPMFVEAPVGAIRAAGFEVIPTGTGADHFDVQLIVGVTEADPPPSERDVRDAATRVLDVAGEMRPNPFYTDDTGYVPEEN